MKIVIRANTLGLEDIRELADICYNDTAFYAVSTTWWTLSRDDLYRHKDKDLPCDPRGCMLLQAPAHKFIKHATDNEDKYGKHKLLAFAAAYHGNIVLQDNGWPTSLDNWDLVNKLLDTGFIEGGK
jgi:hypothetical protein